jgi:hypothetical protein
MTGQFDTGTSVSEQDITPQNPISSKFARMSSSNDKKKVTF